MPTEMMREAVESEARQMKESTDADRQSIPEPARTIHRDSVSALGDSISTSQILQT
jgi:hypothetical protein